MNFKAIILILSFLPLTSCAQKIFEDNFDGESLNMNYWSFEEGDGCPNLCGWGNNELQIYSRDYVKVEDGNLVITALKKGDQYYSGKINTKDKVELQFGSIEVRAKLATGKGFWPALWMLGADVNEVGWPASGEIDIMEYVGKEPGKVFTSLHTPASHGKTINTKKTKIEGIEDGFHIFRADWSDKDIKFYVDNALVYTFIPKAYDKANFPFNKPFYFLINLAVGGNLGGSIVDESSLPQKLYVDYIKVTKL